MQKFGAALAGILALSCAKEAILEDNISEKGEQTVHAVTVPDVNMKHNNLFLKEKIEIPYYGNSQRLLCIDDVNQDGLTEIVLSFYEEEKGKNPPYFEGVGAISAKGEILWHSRRSASHWSTPSLIKNGDDVDVLVANHQGIAILDGKTGHTKLARDGVKVLGAGCGEFDGKNRLFYSDNNIIAHLVDIDSGKELWNINLSGRNYTRPLISDINQDGKKEILFLAHYYPEMRDDLYCLNESGEVIWKFAMPDFGYSPPICADFMNNNGLQIAVGCDTNYILVDPKGKEIWRCPTGLKGSSTKNTSYFKLWDATFDDIDNDGILEIVFGTANDSVFLLKGNTGRVHSICKGSHGGSMYGAPIIADLDQDGEKEIIAGSIVREKKEYIYGWKHNGKLMLEQSFGSELSSRFKPLKFADVDQDGKKELVFVGGNGKIHIMSNDYKRISVD